MSESTNEVIKYIDFVGAVVCGFCGGAWIEFVRDDNGFVLSNFIWYVSVEVISYATAALILMKWNGKPRWTLGWLVILLLGGAMSFSSISAVESFNYARRFMGEAWFADFLKSFVEWTVVRAIFLTPIMVAVRGLYVLIKFLRDKNLARVS